MNALRLKKVFSDFLRTHVDFFCVCSFFARFICFSLSSVAMFFCLMDILYSLRSSLVFGGHFRAYFLLVFVVSVARGFHLFQAALSSMAWRLDRRPSSFAFCYVRILVISMDLFFVFVTNTNTAESSFFT